MIRLENVLKISLQDVLKTSSKRLADALKMSWRRFSRRLQNVLKMSWKRFEDILKMSWRCFCKTSWRRLGKTSWRHLENVLKTSSEDVRHIRLDQDVLKTSSEDEDERRLHQDECLLGCFLVNIQKIFISEWLILIFTLGRSSVPELFYKKGVHRNFAKFTGKHLCQCLF